MPKKEKTKVKEQEKIDTTHTEAVGTSSPINVFEGTNESNTLLVGSKGVKVYDKMRKDPDVAMVLTITSTPIIGAEWKISSQGTDEKEQEIAKFFYDYFWEKAPEKFSKILKDMLMMLTYGFVFFEKVWVEKWINGKQYLICELQFRHPLTIESIDITKRIVRQYADNKYIDLPFDNLLMLVYNQEGLDYWGNSLIRPCYEPYTDKALNTGKWRIAGTRQATGFVHVEHPSTLKKTDQEYIDLKAALTNIATAKNPYLMTPPNYKVTQHQPNITADFYKTTDEAWTVKIRNTGLANFMGLGTTATGTYSVGEIQLNMFMKAEEAICRYIEQSFNQVLREMVIVNFGIQEKYPELKCPELNKDLALKMLTAAKDYFNNGMIKPTKKDEDEIRARVNFPSRDNDDEIMEVTPLIVGEQAQQPQLTNKKQNIMEITNSFIPSKRNSEIDALSSEMLTAMKSNLGVIADKAKADIRTYLKNNGIAGLFDNVVFGKNNYQSILTKKLSFLAIKGWEDAKAYAEKNGVKLTNKKEDLQDGDIKKVPSVLRGYISNKAKNLAQQQVTELEAIVWHTANKPDVGIDIDALIGEIGNKVDEYINSQRITVQADMSVVQTLNDSEQTFYQSEEVEIAYFVYVATIDNQTTEYCKWLNGRTFTPYGPVYKIIFPPRHFGCRSYLIPVFGKVAIPDLTRHDTVPPPSLMAIQQF